MIENLVLTGDEDHLAMGNDLGNQITETQDTITCTAVPAPILSAAGSATTCWTAAPEQTLTC
jgi:hypothetical protein